MSAILDRGILDLTGDAPSQPLLVFEPGDGGSYTVGAIPLEYKRQPRLMFLFGKNSGASAKIAFVLDQPAAHINWDTFAKLFQSERQNISVRDTWVGWLAFRAVFGLPTALPELDSWDIKQFEQATQKGLAADELARWEVDWAVPLRALGMWLGF